MDMDRKDEILASQDHDLEMLDYNCVKKSMDEYAKEIAIGFAEWAERKRYWADLGGFGGNLDCLILYWSNDSVNPQNYTTEQLFNQYLKTLIP